MENQSHPSIKPKNWMVESILATIFCCMPLGVVGIINASKVNSLYEVGDIAGAEAASKQAGKWVKIAAIAGLTFLIIYIAIFVIAGVGLYSSDITID